MKLLEIVNMMDIKEHGSMAYKFFDKNTGSGMSVNEKLAEKLHKPVIKKFKTKKVYARFKDNILAAMGSFS